jgi:cysteine desulfuration protein SufE
MGSMPPKLARIVDLFAGAPKNLRVEALLEYSRKVPPLPPHLQGHQEDMEQVQECQTPFFLSAEVDGDCRVTAWYDCPPEAPTTRGFAGILAEGLNGATAEEVLEVPNDFYTQMGLAEAISSLRLRGMGAILGHLKRQVREQGAGCS